uniref:PRELI/MSF1 domain-containing protein n=1 Tax=Romanomermis culicivorax TaxID=13658 RepID=A0A915ILZ5_ROMCU
MRISVWMSGYPTHITSVGYIYLFRPDPENPRRTHVSRAVWISSPMKGVSHLLEKFGIERFKHNSANTTKGLKQVLKISYEKDFGDAPKLSGKVIGDMVGKVKGGAQKISKTGKEVLS